MTTAELHEILDNPQRKLTLAELRKILQELKQDCNDQYYKEFMGKGEEDIVNFYRGETNAFHICLDLLEHLEGENDERN